MSQATMTASIQVYGAPVRADVETLEMVGDDVFVLSIGNGEGGSTAFSDQKIQAFVSLKQLFRIHCVIGRALKAQESPKPTDPYKATATPASPDEARLFELQEERDTWAEAKFANGEDGRRLGQEFPEKAAEVREIIGRVF